MSDDNFKAFLEREAGRVNEPPADVPREEMWAAIASARAGSRPQAGGAGAAVPVSVDGVTGRSSPRPRRPTYSNPWIGMAATLLLGLGIGRYMIAREMGTVPAVDSLAVAASRATTGIAAADSPRTDEDASAPGASVVSPMSAATRFVAASRSGAGPVAAVPAPSIRRDGGSETYSVASQQHLSRAEALVAVVSAMPADAALDSLTGRWARDVLTNTRLLLDSPAGDDPVRRRLLEDLETVLVQLVQRSGRTVEDRAMIDRTLLKTQILTRLRSGATGT